MKPIKSFEITEIKRDWDKGGLYFTVTFEVANEAATALSEALKEGAGMFNVNLWCDVEPVSKRWPLEIKDEVQR